MPPTNPCRYNKDMRKWVTFILSACLLLTGCQSPDTGTPSESHHDKVSRQIEQLKAESQAAASTGSNIKIVVNMLTTDIRDYAAINSLWRYVKPDVHVSRRPDLFDQSGLRIGIAGDTFKVKLGIIKSQIASSEDTELFIVVADGCPGYISIGREISVPRFYYFGRFYKAVDYEFRRAGRSLKVVARRLPSGLIDMELTPVFSKFMGTGGDMELTELSTRVTARPGQLVVLGGVDVTDEESVAAALLSHYDYPRETQTLITVTPYIH